MLSHYFSGDTYKEHIKCISEDQKYSGKNWEPKANANKGEQKQEAWTEVGMKTPDFQCISIKLMDAS